MIKQSFLSLVLLLGLAVYLQAQTGIGTAAPNGSSVLDLTSSTKGLLIPRMTTAERSAIINPAIGLQVYQTDATPGIYYYDGAYWRTVGGNRPVNSTGQAADTSVSTFAGSGSPGSVDATGTAASFNLVLGVATDPAGNVYVSDYNNKIRKITPAGVVTTLAGSGAQGSQNGPGASASFNTPYCLAADAAGNVYVPDYDNNIIRKVTAAGVVTTLAGSGTVGSTDATGTAASFNYPDGVAVDAAGNVYVADKYNNKIRKITSAGVVTTFAGSGSIGSADGASNAATFYIPSDVAVDAAGNVYVSDYGNKKIRKITNGVVSTLAGSGTAGSTDGTGAAASFGDPAGLAVDAAGNVYVADYDNNKIRKITPLGVVTTLAGSGGSGSFDGAPLASTFVAPSDVATDAAGNVYVADEFNYKIRKITNPVSAAPVFDGAGITNLNASNLVTGFVSPARLNSVPAASLTGSYPAMNGSAITNLTAANLTGNIPAANLGAVPAASLTGNYPALSGAAITSLNASNITTGTLNAALLPTIPSSKLSGTLPALDGPLLTNLNASNITTGTLNTALLATVPSSKLSGALPALDGAALTNLNASNLANGSIPAGRLTSVPAASLTGTIPVAAMPSPVVINSTTGQVIIGSPTNVVGTDSVLHIATLEKADISASDGVFLSGGLYGNTRNIANIELRSAGKTPYIDFSNDQSTAYNTRIIQYPTALAFMPSGSGSVCIGQTSSSSSAYLLSVNGNAEKPGGGSWSAFSDRRLKKHIADYTRSKGLYALSLCMIKMNAFVEIEVGGRCLIAVLN